MSDIDTTENAETETDETTTAETAAKRPARNSLPSDVVLARVKELGIQLTDDAAWFRAGPKDGISVAISKAKKVSRCLIYSAQPDHPAITKFSDEERKAKRLGGIRSEIDFTQPVQDCAEALEVVLQAVLNQPAPQPKQPKVPAEPKAPRQSKPKAEKVAKASKGEQAEAGESSPPA